MSEPIRVHVPAKRFCPTLAQGYRSDIVSHSSYRTMAPISLGGVRLTDILLHGARAIPGPNDYVMFDAPYGIIKVYLTWPGYTGGEQLITYDMYCNQERPTRASIACAIAKMFARFLETSKSHRWHPSVARWRICDDSLDGLSAHNIIFNQLINTYENVWQVDCDIMV